MSLSSFKGFGYPDILRIALTLAVISSAGSSLGGSATVASAQGASAPIHVWAAVVVSPPVLSTSQEVNVLFAATNLGSEPIAMTAVREETVLVINGAEWPDSGFTFANGPRSEERVLAPGKSSMFGFGTARLFKQPGVYRLVWKGKGFESLPFEFRVAEHPF